MAVNVRRKKKKTTTKNPHLFNMQLFYVNMCFILLWSQKLLKGHTVPTPNSKALPGHTTTVEEFLGFF